MDAVLHRIEALPGEGRYVVTFRRGDGGEQTAVAHLRGTQVELAESALPLGWTVESEFVAATFDALRAFDTARRLAPSTASLRDVEGGWDVGLGNVVLGTGGVPQCTAHGALTDDGAVWTCPECGAQAVLG